MKQTNHSSFDSFFTVTSSSAREWNWIMCSFKMRLPIPKLFPSDSFDMSSSSSSSSLFMSPVGNRLSGLSKVKFVILSARVCVQCSVRYATACSLSALREKAREKSILMHLHYHRLSTGRNFENSLGWIFIFVACLASLLLRQCFNLYTVRVGITKQSIRSDAK